MHRKALSAILQRVARGSISPADALSKLQHLPYEDRSFVKIDHHRHLRQGVPEVIFAQGKTDRQVIEIARAMHRKSGRFLITKANATIAEGLSLGKGAWHPASGIISVGGERGRKGNVLVLTAGTSDIPVAEEAALTASFLGSRVKTVFDVGVAGLHRLMDNRGAMAKARVIIVVAGMEGALPSVVGGMTDRPIVAVPTSTGYGASLGGLTALFAMLNSCVPGIAVMNIDNGFGAGCLAHKINTAARPR